MKKHLNTFALKEARKMRGMTQRELGVAVGFPEKNADVRIAQYEGGDRAPKEDTIIKLAAALNVDCLSLCDTYVSPFERMTAAEYDAATKTAAIAQILECGLNAIRSAQSLAELDAAIDDTKKRLADTEGKNESIV